jgi:hypothetical protein
MTPCFICGLPAIWQEDDKALCGDCEKLVKEVCD